MIDIISFGDDKYKNTRCTITIGAFDGLHLGHQKLLEKASEVSKQSNSKLMVVTFKTNPKYHLNRISEKHNLVDFDKSLEIYEKYGVDCLNIIDFSPSFSKLSSGEFFIRLSNVCSLVAVVVGLDFRCGNTNNSKNFELQKIVSSLSPSILTYQVELLSDCNGKVYSSSAVREYLRNGNVSLIPSVLGRYYEIRVRNHNSMETMLVKDVEQMLPKVGKYLVLIDNKEAILTVDIETIQISTTFKSSKTIKFIKEI